MLLMPRQIPDINTTCLDKPDFCGYPGFASENFWIRMWVIIKFEPGMKLDGRRWQFIPTLLTVKFLAMRILFSPVGFIHLCEWGK